MIEVKAPATSANLGSGIDCLGLALPLYLTLTFKESDRFALESSQGGNIPLEENYIYIAVRKLFRMAGRPLAPLRITANSEIPLSRGLGSSAAAIVGGLAGANALLGDLFTAQQLIDAATEIEGHPDNVVPCFTGGFTAAMADGGAVLYVQKPIKAKALFVAAVPDYTLDTKQARAVLPQSVPLADCLAQVQRACYLTALLSGGKLDNLGAATRDAIFTPARRALVPGFDAVCAGAREAGALCVYLSGAGPTVMAVASGKKTAEDVAAAMRAAFESAGIACAVHILPPQNEGVCVHTTATE